MPDVEFFRKSDNKPLHFNSEENRFEWRQYTPDNWYVHVSDPNINSVFVWVAGKQFPLKKYFSEDCFTLSLDKDTDIQKDIAKWIEQETGQEPNPGGWVALLDLWSSNGIEPKRLDPPLYIEPGNLKDKDFDRIVKQLQGLAYFRHSPTQVKQESGGSHTEGGRDNSEDALLVQAADKFLTLIRQVHSNWTLIQETPSCETQLLPKIVDTFSAAGSYSSRLVAKTAQHPYARRVEVLMPQESPVTVENRFLVYVLQEIRQKAPLFERRLLARSEELKKEWAEGQDKESKPRQAQPQWQKEQSAQLELAKNLAELAGKIAKGAAEVLSYIDASFLREVRDLPALPNRPTDRLTRSFNYSPIYFAFCDYQNQPGISFAPLKPGVMKALETKAIHPACTLYELWVFIELYEMLIRTFGFQPPANSNTRHPFDYVDLEAGEITGNALKNQEFRLELRPVNNQQRVITISLWYDTSQPAKTGSNLRPDLFIKITDSAQAGKIMFFAIDAKYHSYPGYYMKPEREKHGVSSVFDLDLLVIAKEKYHKRLQCNAAFVVHSDSNGDFTDWGDKPCKQKDQWPMEHRYGAVFANPSDTSNLRKLLKCLLMYHMDIENICWSCRCEVKSTDKSVTNFTQHTQYEDGVPVGTAQVPEGQRLVGRNYVCTNCFRSWYRTWCSNPLANNDHTILKLGLDSFHSRDGSGHMICPTCGNA